MKYAFAPALLFLVFGAHAQENVGGMPYSFRHGWQRDPVPTVMAAPFDTDAAAANDAMRSAAGELPLYARMQPVGLGPHDAGKWTELPNGDRLWRLRISSAGAMATELFYSDLYLPAGAIMHVYNDDGSELLGGFTSYNNHPSGLFTTARLMGDASIVEYFEPAAVRGLGRFTITDVAHTYRMNDGTKAGSCEVDVRCGPEGSGWADERDGVVRISVVQPGGLAWCSGSLMNNTRSDCTPYILTALHCGISSTDAQFNQYKFYFRYERDGCGTGTALANKVMTGCARRADSNCGGGANGSDYLLLEANNVIPVSFSPYFNGWDATGVGSATSKCIHHPAGDEKKISTCTTPLVSSQWQSATGSHWRLTWAATTNGHGVTEGGSSGSPLFNTDGRVVGTLTGGRSCCTIDDCGNNTGPDEPDLFGKMSYHWGGDNPNDQVDQLQYWLDSLATGAVVFDGARNPCNQVDPPPPVIPVAAAYPNPATDDIMVVFGDDDTYAERVIVFDALLMSGRAIMDFTPKGGGRTVISTYGLAAGAYFIQVFVNGSATMHGPIIVTE